MANGTTRSAQWAVDGFRYSRTVPKLARGAAEYILAEAHSLRALAYAYLRRPKESARAVAEAEQAGGVMLEALELLFHSAWDEDDAVVAWTADRIVQHEEKLGTRTRAWLVRALRQQLLTLLVGRTTP